MSHPHLLAKTRRAPTARPTTRTVSSTSIPAVKELAALPMIGDERARKLVAARRFKTWDEVEAVPGIGRGVVDDMRSGGAKVKRVIRRAVETILGQR